MPRPRSEPLRQPPTPPLRPDRRRAPRWADHERGDGLPRATWPRAAARGPCGRRPGHRLAAPGRARGRGGRGRRARRPGVRARRQATSTGSSAALARVLGDGAPRRPHRRRGPGRALPRLPARGPRCGAASWSAPARRRSPRSATSGWSSCWDDGDDLHAEPRAPYPHTRETLLLRAEREGTAALVGGFARSVGGATTSLRTGWAHELSAPRAVLRDRVSVSVVGRATRGPRPARAAAPGCPPRCTGWSGRRWSSGRCSCRPRGGLRRRRWRASAAAPRPAAAPARARWRCPRRPRRRPAAGAAPTSPAWACAACGHRGLRAPVVGDARTAEELGRAFPRRPGAHRRRRPVLADGRRPARRSSSRRPAPSRSPRAATPPSSCSTPG